MKYKRKYEIGKLTFLLSLSDPKPKRVCSINTQTAHKSFCYEFMFSTFSSKPPDSRKVPDDYCLISLKRITENFSWREEEVGYCGSSTKSGKTVAGKEQQQQQVGENFDKCSSVYKHYRIIYIISMSDCQPYENDNLSLEMKIYFPLWIKRGGEATTNDINDYDKFWNKF